MKLNFDKKKLLIMGLILLPLFICIPMDSGAEITPGISGPMGLPADDPLLLRVSLDLRDMDMVDVLKFLSVKGHFNVVINRNIAGRVTLILKEVTIGDALDIILRSNGLAYNRSRNIIHIMTEEEYLATYGKRFGDQTEVEIVNLQYAKPSYVLAALDNLKSNVGRIVIDEDAGSVILIDTRESLDRMLGTLYEMDQESMVKVFNLDHADAEDVAAQLKVRLDAKSVGTIQADDRSNQVIVTALPKRLTEVEGLIQRLDKPTKAVLIEVRILQLTLNPKYDYGIDWSNPFGRAKTGFLAVSDIKQAFPISSTVSSVGTLSTFSYGLVNANNLQVKINALKEVNDTRILAKPRLMVTHNEEAKIHIGDTIPYVTSTTTGTGDTATVSEEINFIDVGIKLSVTPTISDNGYIKMKIRPEISSQTKTVSTPQKAEIPQVNTTFVDSTVMVQDGHTVVIGGLRQLTNKQKSLGMPKLMKLPLIGGLFRNRSDNLEGKEIVLFLTPHIVSGKSFSGDEKPDSEFPDQPVPDAGSQKIPKNVGADILPDKKYPGSSNGR